MAMAEVITPGVGAETIKVGDEVTIDDVCTFTVKSVQEYDVFMNVESGSAQQFLVVSFDMLNWQTEPFYVRTQTSAELTYDEDFPFTSTFCGPIRVEHILFSIRMAAFTMIRVYDVDDNGNLICLKRAESTGYENIVVERDTAH